MQTQTAHQLKLHYNLIKHILNSLSLPHHASEMIAVFELKAG